MKRGKVILLNSFFLFIIFLLTACGLSQPALPEDNPTTPFNSPLATRITTFFSPLSTLEPLEPIEPSPAPLETTLPVTNTAAPSPAPTVTSVITPTATSTLTPSATPSGEPTPVPLAVNYHFGAPQPLYRFPQQFTESVQWLPNSDNHLLMADGLNSEDHIVQFNLTTGERVILLTTERSVIQPVFLSATYQIAYLTQIKEDPDQPSIWHLFLKDENDSNLVGRSVRRNVRQPLIPTFDGAGVWIFEREMTTLTQLDTHGEMQTTLTFPTPPLPFTDGDSGPFEEYRVA